MQAEERKKCTGERKKKKRKEMGDVGVGVGVERSGEKGDGSDERRERNAVTHARRVREARVNEEVRARTANVRVHLRARVRAREGLL